MFIYEIANYLFIYFFEIYTILKYNVCWVFSQRINYIERLCIYEIAILWMYKILCWVYLHEKNYSECVYAKL
jgi:hypothetical protein